MWAGRLRLLSHVLTGSVDQFACQVGLCAITCALDFFDKVYAFDLSEVRRTAATRHGAIALPLDKLKEDITAATDGRGADAILEIVGHPSAMQTAMRLVRPCGIISSCGMHTHSVVLNGPALFNKKSVHTSRTLTPRKHLTIEMQHPVPVRALLCADIFRPRT